MSADDQDDRMFIPWSEFQNLTKVYNDFETPHTLKPLDWLKFQRTLPEMFSVTGDGATQIVMADGRVWSQYQQYVFKTLADHTAAKNEVLKAETNALRQLKGLPTQ